MGQPPRSKWGLLGPQLTPRTAGRPSDGPLMGPAYRYPAEEERRVRGGTHWLPGCISSSTAYLLPDLLSEVIQLLGQRVYLQGPFKLPLVAEQVAMETVPPDGEGVRLSLR